MALVGLLTGLAGLAGFLAQAFYTATSVGDSIAAEKIRILQNNLNRISRKVNKKISLNNADINNLNSMYNQISQFRTYIDPRNLDKIERYLHDNQTKIKELYKENETLQTGLQERQSEINNQPTGINALFNKDKEGNTIGYFDHKFEKLIKD